MLPDRVPHTSKVGMKNLQNLVPAFIIALAVLAGLLGGAKIISNGIVEANRFQFITNEDSPMLFDRESGAVFSNWDGNWETGYNYAEYREINDVRDWVRYLKWVEEKLKEAR